MGVRGVIDILVLCRSTSVMDNMVKMLEKYSSGLEELVQERTVQVEEEKKKSEILLFRMLPK